MRSTSHQGDQKQASSRCPRILLFSFNGRVITVSQVGHESAEMGKRFGPSSPPHSRYSLHSLSMSDWLHTQPANRKRRLTAERHRRARRELGKN